MNKLESVKAKIIEAVPEKNGNRKTHGMTGSRLYKIWSGMKRRCLNKNDINYRKYGAKGISICAEWMKFEGFLRDMQQGYEHGLSIDRINNSKGYSKDNCRWIPRGEQSKNRKVVILYEKDGLKMTLTDWAKKVGLNPATVARRIRVYGWSFEQAISKSTFRGNGIVFDKFRDKYKVEVWKEGKRYWLGRYNSLGEAQAARNKF